MSEVFEAAVEIRDPLSEITNRLEALTPGSPTYVRRLRDRYVGQALAGLCGNLDGARATAQIDKGTDVTETMGVTAKAFADAAIRALGYQVPEDAP